MDESGKKVLREKILALAKNELRVSCAESDGEPDLLASRIGGRPAVPEGFERPYYYGAGYYEENFENRPMSFLLQVNLKDVADLDEENLLPKTGILSFFYEVETMRWGFDPKDKGCSKVFYFPEGTELHFAEMPEDFCDIGVLPEFDVDIEKHISLYNECDLDQLDCDWDDYEECCNELGYEFDDMGEFTKLLGYPDVIQSPMEEDCERLARGYRCGSPEDYDAIPDAEKDDIKAKAEEWILLFQMGTVANDEGYELMFGDCGHIYFWIKKYDLKNAIFDNVWLIAQCG